MRRNNKKQFWFSDDEAEILATNSKKTGLSESKYIREILETLFANFNIDRKKCEITIEVNPRNCL